MKRQQHLPFFSLTMNMVLRRHPISLAMAAIATAVLLGVSLFALKLSLARRKRKYHPVAGTIFHLLINFRRLHHFSTGLARKHKTYRLLSPFCNLIFTADPANVEYILKTNFLNYGKGQYTYCNLKDVAGDGIFAVDGEKWRHQRKLANIEFSKRVLREYSSTVFISNAAKLASLVSEIARSNSIMDIQDLFMKSTMDSIFQVAFGVELNSLYRSNKELRKCVEAFDDVSSILAWRYVDISWKIKKFLNIGSEAELKEKVKVMDDAVYRIIRNKIEEAASEERNDSLKKGDILSRLLVEREQDPKNITQKYLRDIILSFIIAGKDTTAVTLAWFFYMLCKHPSIQEKAAQEVMLVTKATGESASIGEFSSSLTDESIEKMQYLHATLTETLRLYPAIPMDPKFCFSDDTLPDGYDIRKGDMVVYLPYAMGRMKFIWGDDAVVFRPERWLNDDGVFSPESPFKFTAFQAGPRICLGKEFAYRQMKILAAVLLRFFKFKLRDGDQPVKYRTMLSLNIDKGLHLHAIHR